MVGKLFRWKLLLPAVQSMAAIALWLYTPVQYKKERLLLMHRPAEHPFRIRIEGGPQLFPPTCEQWLQIVNFPAYAISHGLVNPTLNQVDHWGPVLGLRWDFTLPISDPEALPPRRIFYFVSLNEIIFFGLIILLWFWVGWQIDDYFSNRRGGHPMRRRRFRVLELVVIWALSLFSVGFSIWHMAQAISAQSLRVGVLGLIWPTALLIYAWRHRPAQASLATHQRVAGPA